MEPGVPAGPKQAPVRPRQAGQRTIAAAQVALQRDPQEVASCSTGPARRPASSSFISERASPATAGPTIPVWIRDGWEVEEKTVLSDARAAGDSAAIVYGFIPRKKAEELKQAIASYYAAKTTLHTKGSPNTPEGMEAKKAMETRLRTWPRRPGTT